MQNITIPANCECGCKNLGFLDRQKVKRILADAIKQETQHYDRWSEQNRYKDPKDRKPYSGMKPNTGKAFQESVVQQAEERLRLEKHLKNTEVRKRDWEADYERVCKEAKPKNAYNTLGYWEEKAAYTFHHEDLTKLQIMRTQLETEKAMKRRANEQQAVQAAKLKKEAEIKAVAVDRVKSPKSKERLIAKNPNSLAAKMQKKYEAKKLKKSQT